MNVAMMQPTYLPWQGLFELIQKSDIFIFLDDFQFSVQSWHQRNRLFVNSGQVDWYTVPVLKSVSFKSPLNKTKINEVAPWRRKTWARLQQNYSKALFYSLLAPLIEKWIFTQTDSLSQLNTGFIQIVCGLLQVKSQFRYSSEFQSQLQRSQRVVELLRWCNADTYLCAKGSFEYMLEDGAFPLQDIAVKFQDYIPRPYPQIGAQAEFVPFLSILDALFNIGPEKTTQLINQGTEKWLSWTDMLTNFNAHPNGSQAK
jgi:hypothetical protein